MILLDSSIPMYLIGASHPNKNVARILLERCVTERERMVTDAEVLQEILHRYVAINRRDAIQPAFDALLGIVDDVFPVELEDVQGARTIVQSSGRLSARDAIHLAVMKRRGIDRIMSFDAGYDEVAGIRRISS